MQCLFLDDDEYRHKSILKDWEDDLSIEVYHVRTAKEAIEKLQTKHFDFVSLDHDLGGRTFVSSEEEETGYAVAAFIARMTDPPKVIRIHSYNPAGARNMLGVLAEPALEKGLRIYYQPFNGKLR